MCPGDFFTVAASEWSVATKVAQRGAWEREGSLKPKLGKNCGDKVADVLCSSLQCRSQQGGDEVN